MPGEAALRSVPPPSNSLVRAVVCAGNAHQRARFIDALRGRATTSFVESLPELKQLLRSRVDDIDAVILPSRDRDDFGAEPVVREITLTRPKVAVIAYCEPGTQYSTDIRSLAIAGVHQIVFRVLDDGGATLRTILGAARRQCAAGWVMQRLAPIIPAMLHPIVETILARPDVVTSVRELANAAGIHRKTLFNRCESAECIPPAELLAWCRLALVAYHLENTGCTIEAIAIELGYPSDTALRNAMKRYTGLRAGEIRARGGVAPVLDALRRRMRDRKPPRPLHLT